MILRSPFFVSSSKNPFLGSFCAQDFGLPHARIESYPDCGSDLAISAFHCDSQHFPPVRIMVAFIADSRHCHSSSFILGDFPDLEGVLDCRPQIRQYISDRTIRE